MKRAVGAVATAALLLDLLVVALFVVDLRDSVTLETTTLVHDGGLAWRTVEKPLQGMFLSAATDGRWSAIDTEAVLRENDEPLTLAHASHEEIRILGGGRWSYWKGQVYLSTTDGSNPTTNGRVYRIEAPRQPSALLLLIASTLSIAGFVLLRRHWPGFRSASDGFVDLIATRFPGDDPHPLGSVAPWLLALAVGVTFSGWLGAGRWLHWDFTDGASTFIPPFLTSADFLIGALLVLVIVIARPRPSVTTLAALALVTACLVAGGLPEAVVNEWQPQITGVIQVARFSLAFLAAWSVTRAGGARALSPTVALLGAIWIVGVARAALRGEGQFIMVGGHFPSFAGMVLALVAIYSVHRRAFVWAAFALVGIVATGSRTALVATALVMLLPALRFGRAAWPFLPQRDDDALPASRAVRRSGLLAAGTIVVVGVIAMLASSQLRSYFWLKLTPSHWMTFGRRFDITQWTIATLEDGGWRWLGWGCGRAPAFISDGLLRGTMPEDWGNLHIVWLEWIVELGIFAIPLAMLVLWRALASWRRAVLPAALWLLFVLSQTFDYWLWARDGLIIWGLFLGLAEGLAKPSSRRAGDQRAGADAIAAR